MNKNKNKLIKKIGVGLGLSLMTFGIGIGLGYSQYKENNYAVAKAFSYDDEDYLITLTSNEFYNYTFNNLAEYFESFNSSDDLEVFDGLKVYTYLDGNNTKITMETNEYYLGDGIYFDSGELDLVFYNIATTGACRIILPTDGGDTLIGYYIYNEENNQYNFDHDLVFDFSHNQSIYNAFKTAIELDIAANTPSEDLGSQLLDAITSGLGLIGSLAQQFLLGFSALFWNATANELTTFGVYACVMLGIGITMSVISLCLNIIRGNTGA